MLRSIITGITGTIISILSIASAANGANFDIQREIGQNEVIYHISMDKEEQVQLGDANLALVLKKLEDFRCPVGMNCWWEGGIVLHMDIIKNKEMTETMFLYQNEPTSIRLFNRIVTITDISESDNTYQISLKMANAVD